MGGRTTMKNDSICTPAFSKNEVPFADPAVSQALDEAIAKASRIGEAFTEFRQLLDSRLFAEADGQLKAFDVAGVAADLLLDLLSITLNEAEHLPSRAGFYDRVEAELSARPGWDPALLACLKHTTVVNRFLSHLPMRNGD